MKTAIIGSRNLTLADFGGSFTDYLPSETTTIISGGAKGIDSCARDWADQHGLEFIEFLPDYRRYGRGATHHRNDEIIAAADLVLAFWDGKSRGTASVIEKCRKRGVEVRVITPDK